MGDAQSGTRPEGATKPEIAIGLTGPNAAGKGEVAQLLEAAGYRVYSLSDVVREAARAAGLDVSREALIATGQSLRAERGPGVLAALTLPKLAEARVVIDSIRHPAEVEILRTLPSFRLLGVDAAVELRWERAVRRGREGDVPDLDTFRSREARENQDRPDSQQLLRTLALADAVLRNDGSLDDLRRDARALLVSWGALGGPQKAT